MVGNENEKRQVIQSLRKRGNNEGKERRGRELLKAEVGGERKKIRVFQRVGRGKAERRKGRNKG